MCMVKRICAADSKLKRYFVIFSSILIMLLFCANGAIAEKKAKKQKWLEPYNSAKQVFEAGNYDEADKLLSLALKEAESSEAAIVICEIY